MVNSNSFLIHNKHLDMETSFICLRITKCYVLKSIQLYHYIACKVLLLSTLLKFSSNLFVSIKFKKIKHFLVTYKR